MEILPTDVKTCGEMRILFGTAHPFARNEGQRPRTEKNAVVKRAQKNCDKGRTPIRVELEILERVKTIYFVQVRVKCALCIFFKVLCATASLCKSVFVKNICM